MPDTIGLYLTIQSNLNDLIESIADELAVLALSLAVTDITTTNGFCESIDAVLVNEPAVAVFNTVKSDNNVVGITKLPVVVVTLTALLLPVLG